MTRLPVWVVGVEGVDADGRRGRPGDVRVSAGWLAVSGRSARGDGGTT
ncbi:MAG: hypothetical protein FWD75_01020 [Propionibacteriaceae bacterium]|nr:hypothetical protein [Propionibacteriaceae bacterium]